MHGGVIGTECDGLSDQFNSPVGTPLLTVENSQQIECTGMLWLMDQHLPAQGFGLRKSAQALLFQCGRKEFLRRIAGWVHCIRYRSPPDTERNKRPPEIRAALCLKATQAFFCLHPRQSSAHQGQGADRHSTESHDEGGR